MSTLRQFVSALDRGAWIRFFVAIAGLLLAFAAAMFSTVLRESGNVLGTAIAASLALLTAGFVAIYTVPYLAKRAALETLRENFDYDVTREGLFYLGIALLIGVAALNTGNNLLFIVVAAMLAGISVSGVASAVDLLGLNLDVILPAHIFAKQSVIARVNLRKAALFPSFSLSVVPPKAKDARRLVWTRSKFGFPPNVPRQEQWFQLPDMSVKIIDQPRAKDAIFQGSVYFPFIGRRGMAHADVELNFPRRGQYVQDGFGISTRFPFSFLRKTRRVRMTREVVVYPSVEETDELMQVLPMISGEFESFVQGRGYDLYRIREHLPGDSARNVDWKATAKSGTLKVREFTREDERKLRIVFDNPEPGTVPAEAYENAVALAASLSWHFAELNTQLFYTAPEYHGSREVTDFLHYLALVQPQASSRSVLETLSTIDEYKIVLTARARGSIPTQLWASSYILYIGAQ
jgi:uncharacterized protein (DUF58 family)